MSRKTKIEEYDQILLKVPDDKRVIARKLITELTFMEQTLENLRIKIRADGETEAFKQGKQDFLRESPALKAYNTTVQRYSVMYRQLTDLMVKSAETEKPNAVYEFLREAEIR